MIFGWRVELEEGIIDGQAEIVGTLHTSHGRCESIRERPIGYE